MSDAPTFAAPSGPTSGLQRYNLERGPKQLYPATIAGLMGRLRLVAARRRRFLRGAMKKDITMPTDTLKGLIGTLQESVSEILAKASTPEERDALLKQSFTEFGDAMTGELEKMAPEEDDLFKGLGCVGRVAQLVQNLASQVKNIQEGYDGWGKPIGSDGKVEKGEDPASEDVSELLDGMVRMGEMALRAAVNEHVELHDDGDDVPDGYRLVAVPSIEDPDDAGLAVVVKTHLPEDLAKFATDPGVLAEDMADLGITTLLRVGVSPRRLEKALGIDGLAKAYGLAKAEGDEDDEEMPEDGEEMPPEGEGGDPDMEGGEDEAADDPLDVLGRLLAGAMIQLSHIQEMMNGGAPEGEEEAPPAPPPAAEGEGEGEKAPPPPPAEGEGEGGDKEEDEEAQKGVTSGSLEKKVDALVDIVGQLQKLAANQPTPPKGVTMAVGVTKEQDTGGALAKDGGGKTPQQVAEEELAKMDPSDRALAAFKLAHQHPVRVQI